MTAANDLPLEVTCRSVKEKLDTGEVFLLLDCREADEYAVARIEGARLLPMSELSSRLAELEAYRDKQIVVHCHHGGRSERVANWLRGQGFAQARTMVGGIDRWAEEIDRTVPRY
ncbi:MAG TPA: rhodanese-like domain-containing protein [Pirellulales bacterium]|nr:rhodanese-like domain-containing protein [Pirellulales bacterium]